MDVKIIYLVESLVENKQILYGLASGVITGIFASIIVFWELSGKIDDFLFSIIYQQLLASGLSGEKALEIANKTIGELKWIHWLTVVSPIINHDFARSITRLADTCFY